MKNGFTLLEVSLAMLVMSILILIVGRFTSYGLSYSVESLDISSNEKNVNASMIFLEENIVDKTEIDIVYGKTMGQIGIRNQIKSSERVELEGIFFKGGAGRQVGDNSCGFGLKFLSPDKKLFYYKEKNGSNIMECLVGIDRIYVEPIPDGRAYGDAYGIRFIFKLGDSSARELNRSIYFKNHEERIGERDE